MNGFLSEVAQRLYERYGDDISSLTVVFPSQRAKLFFCDALYRIAPHPIWAPRFVSMDELMMRVAPLRTAEPLRLVAELFKVYSAKVYTEEDRETFDHFYHWGEMLLADFDMIDKYRVDAHRLFRNIHDIKELESDIDYFTPAQLNLVREFWGALYGGGTLSEQKRRFLDIWQSLSSIYDEFRARLRELGIGYVGMIYRDAAERAESATEPMFEPGRYVVAGFNALSRCEQSLLKYMTHNCDVEFFWDYDLFYASDRVVKDHEAGMFIRENLSMFPQRSPISCDNFKNIESLNVVSMSTAVAQCKYVVSLLREIAGRDPEGNQRPLDKDTAVVLTDESLLMPLLYALPEDLGEVNVTMGYPLRNTLVYSFIERLLELQHHARGEGDATTFYHVDVDGLLTHPYIADSAPEQIATIRSKIQSDRIFNAPKSMLSTTPLLDALFVRVSGAAELIDYMVAVLNLVAQLDYAGCDERYRAGYISLAVESLVKLRNIMVECDVDIPDKACRALVRRHLQGVKIPFRGEPLKGLQIMGILETRNLDFRNVLILSMSDANFPGSRIVDSSFIPYNLRFGYELPTPEHHEGVYAYYFYRLLQRCNKAWLLYCSASDSGSTGEPSRYIRQLEFETSIPLTYTNVSVSLKATKTEPISIVKDEAVMDTLMGYTDGRRKLSPTRFSHYVACPLRFYFETIAGLRDEQELTDEFDSKLFGDVFHRAAELFYIPLAGEVSPAALIERDIAQGRVEESVDLAIKEYSVKGNGGGSLTGEASIIRDMLVGYLRDNVLAYDIKRNDFAISGLETTMVYEFPFTVNGKELKLSFKGRFDRIDSLNNGAMRVVDYKTGRSNLKFENINSVFTSGSEDCLSNYINTLLYSMILHHATGRDVTPELYYVIEMNRTDCVMAITDKSRGADNSTYVSLKEDFEGAVRGVLTDMFDSSKPFTQCEKAETCKICDFIDICARVKEGD